MRRLNVKLFVILLSTLVSAAILTVVVHRLQASNIADAMLYQVEQAEKEGRIEQAARYLGRYLEFSPQDSEQRARLGGLLAQPRLLETARGQRKARFVLEQVLARTPDHNASRALLVRVALAGRNEELAEEHLTFLERALPGSAEVMELKALALEGKGRDVPAVECYRKALAIEPERLENIVRLVQLLRRLELGKPKTHAAEIDALLARAEKIDARHSGVVQIRADRALDRGDIDAARVQLHQALEANPLEIRFYLGLARLEGKTGRTAEAVALIEKGLERLPKGKHFELRWAQANLYLDAGDTAKARRAVAALGDFPAAETATVFLNARLLMQQNLWFEASRELERIEAAAKSARELALQVSLYLGVCYERLGEHGKQLAAYRKAVEIDPLSVAGRRGVAMAQWSLGVTDGAVEALRETASLMKDPADPVKYRLELARMLLLANLKKGTKNWDAVERELDAVDKEAPGRLDTLLIRSETLTNQGKIDEARRLLAAQEKTHGAKADYWLGLASLSERSGDLEHALTTLERAPDAIDVRLARARLLSARNGPDALARIKALEAAAPDFSPDDNARLLFGLGAVYFQRHEPAEAQRLWWRLTGLPRHADNARLRLLLLDLALQQNDEAGIERVLGELKKLDGGSAEGTVYKFAQAMKSVWQARQGKKEMAEVAKKLLNAVDGERPNWDAVELARGEADEILGATDQAIAHYRRAMDLGYRSPELTRKLVLLLTQSHRFDEAEKEIARLQKEAQLGDDMERLAVVISMRRDDYGKAERLIRKAMAEGAKGWHDHFYLAQVLAGENRGAEAEKELRQALALAPGETQPYVALVRLFVRQGRTDDAQAVLEALMAKTPAQERDIALAECYEIMGQIERAGAYLEAALKARPDSVPLRKMQANFLLRTGKLAAAEPVLRGVMTSKHAEDVAWAQRQLALVLMAGGNSKGMQESLKIVGVEIDETGVILRETPAASAEEQVARARVLALQQRRPWRSRAIGLLEEANRKTLLAAEDQFLLAQLYVDQGAEPAWWGKARDILVGLVKSYPRQPQFLALFADQALVHKDVAEADRLTTRLEQVEKTRGLSAGELGSIELRARVLEAEGEGKKALALLKEYADAPKAPAERSFLVAAMHGRLGNLKQALDVCLAVGAGPESRARSVTMILRRYQRSPHFARDKATWEEQTAAAERALKDIANAYPSKLTLRLHLADLYDLLGRYDEVETLCREVLTRDPENLPALNNLAWLLAQRKTRPEEALKLIGHAITVHGPRPELLDTRAVVYLSLDRGEAALADLQRAAREAPSASKLFNLARAYHMMANTKAAREALSRATALGLDDMKLHPTERDAYRRVVAELKGS
ncbi:MAG: tetratricopeptide repeat protein [Gemmataceae bacterium]